jgi:hypothetical protein
MMGKSLHEENTKVGAYMMGKQLKLRQIQKKMAPVAFHFDHQFV